jgi:hypothetical protein
MVPKLDPNWEQEKVATAMGRKDWGTDDAD